MTVFGPKKKVHRDVQRDTLKAAGCEAIHEDRASTAVNESGRKGLWDALARC